MLRLLLALIIVIVAATSAYRATSSKRETSFSRVATAGRTRYGIASRVVAPAEPAGTGATALKSKVQKQAPGTNPGSPHPDSRRAKAVAKKEEINGVAPKAAPVAAQAPQ